MLSRFSINYLKNLNIQRKFLLGFSLMLVLFTANYLSIQYCRNLAKEDALIVDVSGRNRMLSQKIALYAEMIIDGKEEYRKDLLSIIELHNTSIDALKLGGPAPGIDTERTLPASPQEIIPTLNEVETFWKSYKEKALIIAEKPLFVDKITTNTSIDEEGNSHTETGTIQELNPLVINALSYLENNAQEMLAKNNKLVRNYVLSNKEKQDNLDYFTTVFFLITIVILARLLFIVSESMIKPLKRLTAELSSLSEGVLTEVKYDETRLDEIGQLLKTANFLNKTMTQATKFATKVGEGNFDEDYTLASEHDVLGKSLVEMQNKLRSVADDENTRKWQNNGYTLINNLLRINDEAIEDILQRVLSEIIKYVNASQAAFFIIEEEGNDEYLNLAATYAMGRLKYLDKRVHKGEGLVGQCWLEKAPIYLKKVPDGHFEISTGLGHSEPKTLLIIPLIHNDEVCGILEIAFLEEINNSTKDFLELLSADIAATILSIKINNKTKRLLEQAQTQAEELRAQEEEMRQNQEELNATQEEMIRQKSELERELLSLREQLESK
ncbi:MAG: hypothetical protein CMO01_18805 [Thalassobius sp.]|nr:hypothetical protein [Thalassovita sp.]